MENRRIGTIIRIAMVSVMVLSIIFQGTYDPPIAYAWDNIGDYPQEEGVHPAINKAAYDTFVSQRMPTDQYLKNASLDGKPVWGDAWDRSDGTSPTDYIPQASRQKSVKDWLIEGGFSADEPEWDMALRHFYDPTREPHYLTDIIRDLPESAQKLVTKVTWANLTTDAYSWCFGRDNLFSFTNGKEYYRSALADTGNALGKNYGKAWRAVGESMHLISDMTVPAHVRNDAHMPIDIDKLGIRIALFDPLEYYTFTEHVARYGKSQGMSDLYDYHTAYESDQSIQDLFKEVATWTNENFFSRDTVLRYKQSTTSNGQLLYQKPMVVFEPDRSWYYTAFIAGNRDFPVAAPWSIAETAEIRDLHMKNLGILGGGGLQTWLPRLINVGKAKELIWTGDPIDGREAWRIGLAQKLAPPGKALEVAKELASKIAGMPALALKVSKMAINNSISSNIYESLRFSSLAEALMRYMKSEDQTKAIEAFVRKE